MNKVYSIVVISLIFVGWKCQEETKYASSKFSVIFTASVNGEVEPCGWKTDPAGGLARKAHYINNLRSEGKNIIILDSGDLFFQKEYLSDSTRNEMAAKANLIIDSFNEMNSTAINIGDDDLLLGLDFLLSLRDRAKFSFLSSNIYFGEYAKPIFEEFVILNQDGFKIGIFGLTWNEALYPESVTVQDPYTSALKVISKLSGNVDMIIALTHMPFKVEIALAERLPEVDLFIGGHDGKRMIRPKLANEHGIYKAGNEGQSLGIVDIKLTDRQKKINEITSKLLNLKRVEVNLGRLEESLRGMTREKIYQENKADAAKLEELKAKKLNITNKIRDFANTSSFSLIKLSGEYPSDEIVESYVSNFRSHFPIIVKEEDVEEELLFD